MLNLIPFGIGRDKPKHFTSMVDIVWKNKDNLPYAYKILTRGVCDGCALGVAGLHDWTIKGVHLCLTRLNLLRLNTIGPLDHELLKDVSVLEEMDNVALRGLGRLAYPMIRKKGEKGFSRISWDEAYERIVSRIHSTTPDRTAYFVTSRGVTNEIYYMAQKAARAMGTSNVDNAARLCHSPSTSAMKKTLGYSASTCSYTDWYGTDLIVFWGSNPSNDQPVATKYLHEAKCQGTKIVMVNPYLEPGMRRYWVPSTPESAVFGSPLTDYFYPIQTGGDIAFIYGVLRILIEEGWCNEEFIRNHTSGFEELKQAAFSQDMAVLESQCGIDRDGMREFALMLKNAKNAVFIWSMGITQHAFGADAVQMVLNLGLARGYVGREKNGLMPIRGHSSVQGGAEMGAYSTAFPGGVPINPVTAKELSSQYGFPVPDKSGLTTTEMVEACDRGELDLFYMLGGNLLRNLPEPKYVTKALANCPLRVHQDVILTDMMFIEPKDEVILLPAQTRFEQTDGGTSTTTERRIAFSPEIPRQVGEARAEWIILRDLALKVMPGLKDVFGCRSGQEMREEIARVVPFYAGIEKLSKTGEMVQYGGTRICENGVFGTDDGKAHLRSVELPVLQRKEGVYKCSTRRGKQFNSLIYAEVDPITGAQRDAVFINPDDAAKYHLKNGDPIRLKNDTGVMDGHVFYCDILPGNLQVHWPEGNIIIKRGAVDVGGGVPDYNAYVEIESLVGKK